MDKEKVILIVEPDRVWQTRIRNDLKENGYKVASVDSAQEAIDFCIKNVVDMAILELNLPDRDGIYFIQTIRTFNNTLPIIVVSSRNLIETKKTLPRMPLKPPAKAVSVSLENKKNKTNPEKALK